MNKTWKNCKKPSPVDVESLSNSININPVLATVLIQRGVCNFEEAKQFFNPDLDRLYDPFLMKDMDLAVGRLVQALSHHEKILIYGDYDVDGTTSVALVYGFLRKFHTDLLFYINDRELEGYGISKEGIDFAYEQGISLIISLDCGIKAGDLIKLASEKGMDFIVCDHHTTGVTLPEAVAVLDPKREDCSYPYKELSGCGIGFKLLQGLCMQGLGDVDELYSMLDLVSVSIASDIVPITDENRILCFHGLKVLNRNPQPGLKALMGTSEKGEIDISGIVFGIAPRINAAGRIDHANAAVSLMLSTSMEEAEKKAVKVNEKNTLRRDYDKSITEEALAMIREEQSDHFSTVLYSKNWHKGVVGIVASRCIEHYFRPTVVLTSSNGTATGSARSIPGFDLYEAIEQCSELLVKFGGHKYAAGLTLETKNIDAFREKFEKIVEENITEEMKVPVISINSEVQFDVITKNFVNIVARMGPFGPGNMAPVFEARNVYVHNSLQLLKEQHLKFIAGQKGNTAIFDAIGFGLSDYYEDMVTHSSFSMVFTVEHNEYKGRKRIQLRIRDIKFDREHGIESE